MSLHICAEGGKNSVADKSLNIHILCIQSAVVQVSFLHSDAVALPQSRASTARTQCAETLRSF